MATTNELLEEMEAEMLTGENDTFVVDNNLRTVSIPESMSVLGVEHDDDVHRLYFQIPKMYGDTDLSDFDIRINYMNAAGEGDVYAVTDKEVSGDNITFSWLVGRHAFAQRGDVIFIVCLKQTDDEGNVVKEFNTTVTTLPPVLEGLETSELVIQENPDIIEQILARLDDLEENGGGGSGTPGKDGVGIDRIEKTSTQGLVDTYTIYLTDGSNYAFTVTNGANGKDGSPGAKGDPGEDGITPHIGENGNWYIGEEDTGKPSRGEKGDPGDKGDPGQTGVTPNIQIGTVQTLDPGQQATASITGTPENPLLNLGIPKGADADPGSGGGGSQIILLAELQADGESTEITYDVDLSDGVYAMGLIIPANTQDENKGQWLYLKFGGSGIFGSGLRAIGASSNVSVSAVSSSAIILVKDGKAWEISDYGNTGYNYDSGFVGIDVQNKVSLYSQSSKPVPTGVSAKLWRIL